jgi:hypothetical protein
VERVGGPQLVGGLSLEAAEGAQRAALGGQLAVQPDTAEMPLQGALVRAVTMPLGDDTATCAAERRGCSRLS